MTGQRCSCGRVHPTGVTQIHVYPGLLKDWMKHVDLNELGRSCLLVADDNTWSVVGEQVSRQLSDVKLSVNKLVFADEGKGTLVADERSLGRVLMAMESQPDFLIAIGSGTISDLVRYTATQAKIPYYIIATAPSMDGYASSVAPLICRGKKRSYKASAPQGIFADVDILASAPSEMIQAGIGDLLGKITARADWQLAHLLTGEYFCPEVQQKVNGAVQETIAAMGNDLNARLFIEKLILALVDSGQAITAVGNSRPASGSEHMLAHYWEVKALESQRTLGLHGQKVGLATELVLNLYAKVSERVASRGETETMQLFRQVTRDMPTVGSYRRLLAKSGISFHPLKLCIPLDWIRESLLHEAIFSRDRYTVLRYAYERGWLAEIVEEIIQEIPKTEPNPVCE